MHNLFAPWSPTRDDGARGARGRDRRRHLGRAVRHRRRERRDALEEAFESTFAPHRQASTTRSVQAARPPCRRWQQVSPGKYTIYAVAWDGRLHQLNAADGSDVAPPEKFLPPNGKPYALNVVNGVIYTATAQGCGGIPNALYSYHLATRKASIFIPAGGGMWGRRGAAVSPEGVVFMVTGDAHVQPGDQEPRQRHRRRQARRQPAAAARRLLCAAQRQLAVARAIST